MGKKTTLRLAGAVVACALTLGNASAFALSKGDWLFRVRGIDVIPNDSSSEITPAGRAAVPGSEVSVNSAATVEGDITYMATDSIGMELIVANTRHTITDNGVATGALKRTLRHHRGHRRPAPYPAGPVPLHARGKNPALCGRRRERHRVL